MVALAMERMRVVFTGLRLRPPKADYWVLENSYYWRRSPACIRLLRRTRLGVAPLGSGATPFFRTRLSISPSSHQRETPALQSGHVMRNADAGLIGARASYETYK